MGWLCIGRFVSELLFIASRICFFCKWHGYSLGVTCRSSMSNNYLCSYHLFSFFYTIQQKRKPKVTTTASSGMGAATYLPRGSSLPLPISTVKRYISLDIDRVKGLFCPDFDICSRPLTESSAMGTDKCMGTVTRREERVIRTMLAWPGG